MRHGTKTYRWDKKDPQRVKLRGLAAKYGSDYEIARVLGISASSVSWQRRKWRIRLNKRVAQGESVCAAWAEDPRRNAVICPACADDDCLLCDGGLCRCSCTRTLDKLRVA